MQFAARLDSLRVTHEAIQHTDVLDEFLFKDMHEKRTFAMYDHEITTALAEFASTPPTSEDDLKKVEEKVAWCQAMRTHLGVRLTKITREANANFLLPPLPDMDSESDFAIIQHLNVKVTKVLDQVVLDEAEKWSRVKKTLTSDNPEYYRWLFRKHLIAECFNVDLELSKHPLEFVKDEEKKLWRLQRKPFFCNPAGGNWKSTSSALYQAAVAAGEFIPLDPMAKERELLQQLNAKYKELRGVFDALKSKDQLVRNALGEMDYLISERASVATSTQIKSLIDHPEVIPNCKQQLQMLLEVVQDNFKQAEEYRAYVTDKLKAHQ
jgi:hypothetical protein